MSARRRLGCSLLAAGSAIGVIAGIVQAAVGTKIPAWTGHKADPTRLGLLTVGLAGLAAVGAWLLSRASVRGGALVAPVALIGGAALLGFTTAGRAWYLPGLLLLVGLVLGVDDWPAVRVAITGNWSRVLLGSLGCCQILMSVRAQPTVALVGVVAGVALIAAAALADRNRRAILVVVIVGCVLFALLASSALVPPIVAVIAIPLAFVATRRRPTVGPAAA